MVPGISELCGIINQSGLMREINLQQGLFFPPDVFLFNLKPKSCLIKTSVVADLFGESFATSEFLEQGC